MRRSLWYYVNRFLKRNLDYKFQPDKAWSKPTDLWLETGKVCNLRCQMCARELDVRFHEGEDFQDQAFDLLKPWFRTADKVILYGWNEPLMDRQLFEKIESVRKSGAAVHFNTNGMLLTEETCIKLIDLQVTDIGISIDGATKETYEKIRIGGNFEKLKENIKRFVDLKSQKDSFLPYLHLVFCALRPNLDELPRMPALAKELGLPRIDVTDTVFFSDKMVEQFGYEKKDLQEQLKKAQEAGKGIGVEVCYWSYDSDAYLKRISGKKAENTPHERRICHEIYKTMLILANGDGVPCCFQWGAKVGNLKDQSPEELWNGPVLQKLRHAIREGNPPPVCQKCPYLKKPGDSPGHSA